MTFLISFSNMFKSIIGLNILDKSYIILLGLEIMLLRYFSFLITALRCFQNIQSGPRMDELLHLLMTLLNSSLEKKDYVMIGFEGISSKMFRFIWQFYAELNVWCNVF